MPLARILLALFLLGLPSAPCAFAADGPKLALIITNRDYPLEIGSLDGTHRDGERMAKALTSLGFEVVHKRDLDKSATLAEVAAYAGRLAHAGAEATGFFYYAGHGAANSKYGENYLIPVGAPIASDTQLPLLAVKLGEIIDAIGSTGAKSNFVVFDACRDVPISFASRGASRGLRAEAKRPEMLVAFATNPGNTATDEGIFAEALADEIQKPGVYATEVFRAVRKRVLDGTRHKQFPWFEDGLIENVYFKPATAPTLTTSQETRIPSIRPLIADAVNQCEAIARAPLNVAGANSELTPDVALDQIDAVSAVAVCTQALEANPQFSRISYILGRAFHKIGDDLPAFQMFERSAAQGNVRAMFHIAILYAEGKAFPKDYAKVREWYEKAALLGDVEAMENLGHLYAAGKGGAQDYAKARLYYEAAIAKGNVDACYNLGNLYLAGKDVAQDYRKARELYAKAAEAGNVDAMVSLANLQLAGKGGPKKPANAMEWLKKAKELGSTEATARLQATQ